MNKHHISKLILFAGLIIFWAAIGYPNAEQWDARASARVNLRENPSLKGKILGTIPRGYKVRILQTEDSWYRVDVSGEINGKGWVYARYLERTTPKAPEKEPTPVRSHRTNLKNEPIEKSQSEARRQAEPTHQPSAKLGYYRFRQEAPEITGKEFSAQAASRDSIGLPNSTSAAIESPGESARNLLSADGKKPAAADHAMASSVKKSIVTSETNDSKRNQPVTRPVKIALKMVSILLYGIIIVLLCREN